MTSARTLVVSPDPGLVNQVRGAIQVLGGRVATSPTGETALAAALRGGVELVIAAVELPGMDGFELCRRLRELDAPPTTVLVYSGGDHHVASLAGESGADATIRRPFQGNQLAARLAELVGMDFFKSEALAGMRPIAASDPDLHPAAASLVDPASGVFGFAGRGPGRAVASPGESWAEAVVSAAIPVLDDELPDADGLESGSMIPVGAAAGGDAFAASAGRGDGPDETQDLPEVAVQTFDEEHPVSIPVDAATTAHFRPIREDDRLPPQVRVRAVEPAGPAPEGASARVDPLPDGGGFLPDEGTLPPSTDRVYAIVREEMDRLVSPDGKLAAAIQRSVASAVAQAMRQVLPALAIEAARLAQGDAVEDE